VRWWLAVPAALACVIWLLWDFGWLSGSTDSDIATTTSQPTQANSTLASQRATAQPSNLELGMDTDAVRGIEGDPILTGGDRWEYGPSWIRFEDGKVADWYSSPLRPLKTATAQPMPTHN
jgi:hypothetical protein